MELERIQFRGFQPREKVQQGVHKVAEKILKDSPVEGQARLVISDLGERFHISVVGTSRKKLFSSESFHKKQDVKGWPRGWQLGAVAELLGDFIQQVRKAFK